MGRPELGHAWSRAQTLLLLLILFHSSKPLFGCSCVQVTHDPPLSDAEVDRLRLEEHSTVFRGEVIDVTAEGPETRDLGKGVSLPNYPDYAVKFRVLQVWKGASHGEQVVRTGTDCAFPFKAGVTYLVVACCSEKLVTNICQGNRVAPSFKAVRKVLGKPTTVYEPEE